MVRHRRPGGHAWRYCRQAPKRDSECVAATRRARKAGWPRRRGDRQHAARVRRDDKSRNRQVEQDRQRSPHHLGVSVGAERPAGRISRGCLIDSAMIANARMYSVDAATAAAWRTLLEWVRRRADVACEVVDSPPPQPLPALWSRDDLGCAFMCGYPFALAAPRPVLLAAPVPSPSRYAGKPVYWSDLVVHVDSPAKRIEDTFGLRFAYTSEDSQSGYHAARRFLAPYAGLHGTPLFASTVGPLITPRNVVAAIVAGEADVGPVDSYAHDLLRLHEPRLTAQVRTIASTERTQ